MTVSENSEFLEIYKLHAELADRVSQRREGANRLYVSLLAGLVLFLAALFRFGIGDDQTSNSLTRFVLYSASAVGSLLCVSWYIVIRSYRQLNARKYRTLRELERKLSYQFFTHEWNRSGDDTKKTPYWKLTIVEVSLPAIFLLLFLGVIIFLHLQQDEYGSICEHEQTSSARHDDGS